MIYIFSTISVLYAPFYKILSNFFFYQALRETYCTIISIYYRVESTLNKYYLFYVTLQKQTS